MKSNNHSKAPIIRAQNLLKPLKGIIFDLDNTLVSSSLDFREIRQAVNCPVDEDVLSFINEMPENKRQQAMQTLVNFEMTDAKTSFALPSCYELITYIKQQKLPCAIVTRNCSQAASFKITHNKIDISEVITREQFSAKPDPEALLYLAKLWQIPTNNLLYVGDYLYDIQAAKNAQMASCLVTFDRELPYSNQADIAVTDLFELLSFLKHIQSV